MGNSLRIQNRGTDVFLTSQDDNYVITQIFLSSSKLQQWSVSEHSSSGQYLIKNEDSGRYLDIDRVNTVGKYPSVVVAKKDSDKPTQRWYINSDGTVGNNDLYVTVTDAVPGSRVVVKAKIDAADATSAQQKFDFVAMKKVEQAGEV